MPFDQTKFTKKLKKTFDKIAEDYTIKAAVLIEKDIDKRLETQVGYKGQKMPKKKYPNRSKNPTIFLKNTGQSMQLVTSKVGPAHYKIQARRPEVLNYHNPRRGLTIFWGISKELKKDLKILLKRTVKKWLR